MNKFFILLFLIPTLSQGQDSKATVSQKNPVVITTDSISQQSTIAKNYLRKDVWRIDFLGPGYLNEHRLGRQLTLVSQVRLVGAFRSEDRFENTGNFSFKTKKMLAFSINPELSVAVRQFYNLAKRQNARKSIRYNAGSYFALKGNYIAPPIFKNTNINIQGPGISLLWGVQYTARKYFYSNLELGVGAAQYYKDSISPTGDLILGYTF